MFVLVLLVLLLVPAWSMAQGSEETQEPSLAELARSEKERRAQLKAIPILTNSDLRRARGLVRMGIAFNCARRSVSLRASSAREGDG